MFAKVLLGFHSMATPLYRRVANDVNPRPPRNKSYLERETGLGPAARRPILGGSHEGRPLRVCLRGYSVAGRCLTGCRGDGSVRVALGAGQALDAGRSGESVHASAAPKPNLSFGRVRLVVHRLDR